MNFKQNLTVLFWLYRQKAKADGKAPIYARITIDGKYTEISTGKKVNPASWTAGRGNSPKRSEVGASDRQNWG